MWQCANCGIQNEDAFSKCSQCSEKKEDSDSKTKAAINKKKVNTIIVVIGSIIWYSIVLVRNPSRLVMGITMGHLLQLLITVIIAAIAIKFIWRKKSYTDFKMPKNNLSSDEHIIKIYNYFLENRKDLSESGIVFKIEEDYKYKEDAIKKAIEKSKKNENISKAVETNNQQSNIKKQTLKSKPQTDTAVNILQISSAQECLEPLMQVINTSQELLQTNSARQFDVKMGLSDIKGNCEEALMALQKGVDVEGTPITSMEVGKGLRLLWTNFAIGWIDIVKSKMRDNEHMALKRILNEIERISKKLESSNAA